MSSLFAKECGSGTPILFLHGFPMHHQIWDDFVLPFLDSFHVITPDLPGFGKSPILKTPFSIEDVAEHVLRFMDEKGLKDSMIVGHSLGGYVALAMIEKRPEMFSSLCLFHSTAIADSPEKKDSRNKVVEFVEKNGPVAFTTNFIAPLFADNDNAGIERVRRISSQSSADAVIGYTMAMRDRPDRINALQEFNKPTLFMGGDRDPGIAVESIYEQASLCGNAEVSILDHVAHMGMYEKPDEAAAKLLAFWARK